MSCDRSASFVTRSFGALLRMKGKENLFNLRSRAKRGVTKGEADAAQSKMSKP